MKVRTSKFVTATTQRTRSKPWLLVTPPDSNLLESVSTCDADSPERFTTRYVLRITSHKAPVFPAPTSKILDSIVENVLTAPYTISAFANSVSPLFLCIQRGA